MSVPTVCKNTSYTRREPIIPDGRIVAVLQDKIDGTILEKSLDLKYLGRLVTAVDRAKKNNPNYILISVHSFNLDNGEEKTK